MQRKKITLFILIVVGLNFFRFNAIKQSVYVVFDSLVFVHCLIWLNKKKINRAWLSSTISSIKVKQNFKAPLKYMVLGVFISFFPAWIFHGQEIYYSYAVESGFGYVLLYFYLHKREYKVKDIEDIVITIGMIFQVIYWFEIKFQSASPIFGEYWSEESSQLVRLMIWGRHIFMLSFCILLNRFKFNAKALALISIAFLTVILLQTRQLLLPAALVLLYHFRVILFKNFFAAIGLAALVAAGLYFSGDAFDKLVSKTVSQNSQNNLGGDRLQSYLYYLQDKDANAVTRVLGDGYPAPTTGYGDQFKNFLINSGLSPSDIGPVGFVTYFGYLWLISLLVLIYRAFKIKVPPKYMYAKYYMFIVLLTLPVGENQFVAAASILALVITFYVIDKGNSELAEEKRIKNIRSQVVNPDVVPLQLS